MTTTSTAAHGDGLPNQGSMLYVTVIAFVAALGGFLFGYDLVIISGAQLPLKEYFGLEENSWAYGLAVSSAGIGCIFGPFRQSDRIRVDHGLIEKVLTPGGRSLRFGFAPAAKSRQSSRDSADLASTLARQS